MKKLGLMILSLFAAVTLASCGANNFGDDGIDEVELIIDEVLPGPIRQLTLEEMGEIIVVAGTFWEDWWEWRGRFVYGHILAEEHLESTEHPAWVFQPLLPASGFESLGDIRNYLLQYYTEEWVDAELFGEFPVFAEYNGRLYVHTPRAGFPRPNWQTASHILIWQGDNEAIIHTTVLYGIWYADIAEPWEVQYRITFVNGRINSIGEWCALCGSHYVHEALRQPTPPMNMHEILHPDAEALEAEFLANFGFQNVHRTSYIWKHGGRDDDIINRPGGMFLWPDRPLRDFSFVTLDVDGHYWDESEVPARLVIHTQEIILQIPQLLPRDVVVLNVGFRHCLLPHGAIMFTEEDGTRWRMFISESMRGGCFPLFHLGTAHEWTE